MEMEINNQYDKIQKRFNKLTKIRENRLLTEDELQEADLLWEQKKQLDDIIHITDKMKKNIQLIIAEILNLSKGEKFKPAVTFCQLIEYKTKQQYDDTYIQKENLLFKRYLSFMDDLKYKLSFYYPFIDLNDIDLNWTTNQLIDVILDAHFLVQKITVSDIANARLKENQPSIACYKLIKKMEGQKDE